MRGGVSLAAVGRGVGWRGGSLGEGPALPLQEHGRQTQMLSMMNYGFFILRSLKSNISTLRAAVSFKDPRVIYVGLRPLSPSSTAPTSVPTPG